MSDFLVWRSVAIVSALLVAVLGTALAIRKRWPHLLVRVVTALVVLFAVVCSGLAVDTLIQRGNTSSGATRVFIDPAPIVLWLPALLCVTVAMFWWWVQRRKPHTVNGGASGNAG